jgi:tRNA threonylcarbamoyladenosine biosynthesis protein TsaE
VKGVFEVSSVEETWALAKELAKELKPGDVVCLEGDLGAGKTTFTQGLAAALGVPGRVTSPTFCIVQEHQSPDVLLVHMDLYRLHGEEDVEAIGWEDYLSRGAIIAVEWPERAGALLPSSAHHVAFHHKGEEKRRITIDKGSTFEV